jgi:hypothetical protein
MNNLNPQSIEDIKSFIKTTINRSLSKYLGSDKKNNNKWAIWTPEEDRKLQALVAENGTRAWKDIAEYFNNKTAFQCLYRWKKVLKPEAFTASDDEKLMSIKIDSNWNECSKLLNKSVSSLKRRYMELKDNENTVIWNNAKEFYLLQAVKVYGTCWSRISKLFNLGENNIRNKFYSILRKTANLQLNADGKTYKENVSQMRLNELLSFLPIAIEEYKSKVNETEYNEITQRLDFKSENKCESDIIDLNQENGIGKKLNICSACAEKIKNKIKQKLLVSLIQQNNSDNIIQNAKINPTNKFTNWQNINDTAEKLQNIKNILNMLRKTN